MDIVSTGMHNAGNLGLKREIIFFLHRKRVDVRAERDAWTGCFAFYDSDRAGSGDPFHQRDTQGIQGAADVIGSVCLLKGKLWVSMQVTAYFNQFFFIRACDGLDKFFHIRPPFFRLYYLWEQLIGITAY